GTSGLPVVSFTVEVKGEDGKVRTLEIGLRKDTVEREEKVTDEAIRSMFILSLVTVVVSFSICVILVVWMMQREIKREALRRQEEHLAFSGVLANGIVHDFRNPMSSLRLDIQMLSREAGKKAACNLDRLAQLSDRLLNTLDRMEKVFQEFLFLSKPSSEKPERILLAGCLRECMDLVEPRLEHAGVTADLKIEDEKLAARIHVSAFKRAIINLLINAEQFSPRGGVVRIHLGRKKDDVLIDIMDSGPGIPRVARKRLFEMFYTTRPQGTGLGLFLAKAAIERSGGRIRVMEKTERGACFRIILPVAAGDEVKA
ncbi:MAG: ATP-binding protein, partial [Lentisphaerota bacterium]